MAEMRHDLELLRPSHCDTITPKVVVTAPVTEGMSPVDRHTGLNEPSPHQDRLDSNRWVLDATGQPFLISSFTDGTCANSSRKCKRQATVNFMSGTFAEYEEFKRTMKNMSKVIVNLLKRYSWIYQGKPLNILMICLQQTYVMQTSFLKN